MKENLKKVKAEERPQTKKILAIVAICAAVLVIGVMFWQGLGKQGFSKTVKDSFMGEEVAVSPTPFPFQEMTIDYLRDRDYKSTLGTREMLSENESYTSYFTSYDSDGLKINGLLTVPKGEEPEGGWPAIVFIHGYIPPTIYQTTENYVAYVDSLARSGFVVFKIDLRGHADSEGEPSGAYYSSDYIVDARNAISALEESGFVNPEKIGLWGHSMAGNVVMRTVASKRDVPAAVIWGGAVYTYEDWQKYGIQDNSYRPPGMSTQRQRRRDELFGAYGEFDNKSEFWRKVAPTNYLTGLKTSIQLDHAVDDDVVNIGYSRDLAEILEREKIDYEFNEYPSGGHNIQGASFNQAMTDTIEFFKAKL